MYVTEEKIFQVDDVHIMMVRSMQKGALLFQAESRGYYNGLFTQG